ncbi:Mu transposase C-terminal domain-containing protein [Pseudothauera rhizosphaerae]|uniref:Mu transposase, C-terminal n=1 Tax=Pseudothauera rhizosphaerae TaxID=2565932 RepID=A0A4S4AMT8_9RHOO|nr:Mu transposase C-terminal domain-containing protein [Pseudothauera rhizosphaerae]THF60943.1 hypothetical protein E6O51_11990 [Pseudothauera rhizosphaerae]
MSTRVTLAEVADALGVSKQAVAQRAAREAWPFETEIVRGGSRRLYDSAALPKGVQKAVKARATRIQHAAVAAGQAADCEAAQRMLEEVARAGRLKGAELATAAEQVRVDALLNRRSAGIEILRRWPKLTANQVKRMQARLEIVQAYQRWIAAEGQRHGNKALNGFAASYCATAGAACSPDTCESVRKLSGRNLRRWVDGFAATGLAALLDEKDGRDKAGHGKIEDQPEIRELVVGLLVEFPHVKDQRIAEAISARFGTRLAPVTASLKAAQAEGLLARPDVDAIRRFRLAWLKERASAYLALRNPDRWKNQQMLAFGDASEDVVRPNYRWELDSTPGDVLLLDPDAASGTARYAVLGALDVFTRRGKLLVAKTSKSAAIGSLVRRALTDWGWVERVKHDNGSDYCAHYLQTLFHAIGTDPELCAPFSGWQKPHIERFFKTFNHDLVELLPGYIGHNVAERKELEARASFSERLFQKDGVLEVRMTATEFQAFCDEWTDNVYAHNPHAGLDGRTPFEVAASWSEPVARIADERVLDVLLMPLAGRDGYFSLQKKGIRINRHDYIAPELGAYNVGARFAVRQDVADVGRVFVFDDEGTFVCVAVCPDLTGISPAEIAAAAKAVQRRVVREEKAVLKRTARKAGAKEIVAEILRERAASAGKLATMPVRGPAHTTAAIDAAGQAARADARAPAVAGQMVIGGRVVSATRLPTAAAEVTELAPAIRKSRSERSAAENYAEWRALKEAFERGDPLADVDFRFMKSWLTSAQGRMFLRKVG